MLFVAFWRWLGKLADLVFYILSLASRFCDEDV